MTIIRTDGYLIEFISKFSFRSELKSVIHKSAVDQPCSLVLDLSDHTIYDRLRFKPADDLVTRDEITIVVALSHPTLTLPVLFDVGDSQFIWFLLTERYG